MNEKSTAQERRQDHTEMQRNRILDAAELCFSQRGFHAASMANLAETAGVSAGLSYRYFENKRAVVLAIIERQLERRRELICRLKGVDDLADTIRYLFRAWEAGEESEMNPALFFEISAEATRDAEVAKALNESGRQTRSYLRIWLEGLVQEGAIDLRQDQVDETSLAVQCFIEGWVLRAAVQRGDGNKATLLRVLDEGLRQLLRRA